jgi:hypothetical protein
VAIGTLVSVVPLTRSSHTCRTSSRPAAHPQCPYARVGVRASGQAMRADMRLDYWCVSGAYGGLRGPASPEKAAARGMSNASKG